MNIQIEHDPDKMRFVTRAEHGLAHLDYRPIGERALEYSHAFVPEEDRGCGIAGHLVDHAFRYAATHGFRVLPTCPFISARARRNPEFRQIIIEGDRRPQVPDGES